MNFWDRSLQKTLCLIFTNSAEKKTFFRFKQACMWQKITPFGELENNVYQFAHRVWGQHGESKTKYMHG